MHSPNYILHANLLKMLFCFISLILMQYGAYFYISQSDYITFAFIFIALCFFAILALELWLVYYFIKFGRPYICFSTDECTIHVLSLKITLPYNQISSLNLRKIEQDHRGFSFGYDYQLSIYLRNKVEEHNLFRKKTNEVNHFMVASQYFFFDSQILQATIIFSALCRVNKAKRQEILSQLQQKNVSYDQLISPHELKNFKNNQYINKNFKSGQ